ncbi:MAG: hypothetical protein HY908_22810 [Myxococcales bacterium]|nr:hypothetical protein [Myxococcales bacterium]
MSRVELARLVDRAALDEAPGPRGRLRVTVPESWLATPSELEIRVPARLTCARCDGGGCDACGRSGAVRAFAESERDPGPEPEPERDAESEPAPECEPEAEPAPEPEPARTDRRVTVQLPGGGRPVAVRLVNPFGPDGVAQLLIEVVRGATPSPSVSLVRTPALESPRSFARSTLLWVVGALALGAALYLAWRALR